MNKRISQTFIFITLLSLLGCGRLLAKPIPSSESPEAIVSIEDLNAPNSADAPDVIFSNLGPGAGNRYFTLFLLDLPITGTNVRNESESSYAVAFTPKLDAQAKVLAAAIGYIAGTKLVNLGVYSDNDGTVGSLLPGGQGSTTRIPDIGDCCQMAKVTLPGEGVALTAGMRYWLVASSDNVNGADFEGGWQFSNRAASATLAPPSLWRNLPGQWLAAQIRGTKARTTALSDATESLGNGASAGATASRSNVVIYKNLGPPEARYFTSSASLVTGKDAAFQPEEWEAIPLTPKADVHVQTLAAAIGYVSGTKLVNLGIYSDNAGTVGTLLPGGQGSTSEIPNADECCELAIVSLPGSGVALKAGTQYWLVASPDNVRAPTFYGLWHDSGLALDAYQEPEHFINWTSFSGLLSAAEIRGTLP